MGIELNLKQRIYGILGLLACISIAGGVVMIGYTYRMEHLLAEIAEKDLDIFQSAEDLETALANQKGFVSYYLIDGDPDWLRRYGEYQQLFMERLKTVRGLARSARQQEVIDRIEAEYTAYVSNKERVIQLYRNESHETGRQLHSQVRSHFFSVLDLCEQLKGLLRDDIRNARIQSSMEARRLRIIAAAAIAGAMLLAGILVTVFIRQILTPVHRILVSTRGPDPAKSGNDMVSALSNHVKGLLQDVDQTQLELEKSREHLVQSEKMAMVGKLAAGMAHSIRNPFTSVKMRLFSLSRSIKLDETQKEDFNVISEEIRHIDTIIQNFLEFSRPPKLSMQSVSLSTVVDTTLLLLEHRLQSFNVQVQVDRSGPMPTVLADPEQIKEVLVNIVVNACEAMAKGGTIRIREETTATKNGTIGRISISDTGPGVEARFREKIFQPFFTTKDDGTGLGLSIARRIIEEHGGELEVTSGRGGGAIFIISLPIEGGNRESGPYH